MERICSLSGKTCRFKELCFSDISFKENFPDHFKKIKEIDLELLEFLLFKSRRIVKKETLTKSRLEQMITYCEKNSIKYFVISSLTDVSDTAFSDHRYNLILYKERDELRKYIEEDLVVRDENRHRVGHLLGYPECCINAFSERGFEVEGFKHTSLDSFSEFSMKCPLINPFHKLTYLVPFEEGWEESYPYTENILKKVRGKLDFDLRFEDVDPYSLQIGSQDGKFDLLRLFSTDSLHVHVPCSNDCTRTISRVSRVLSYIGKTFGEDYVKAYIYYMKKKYRFVPSDND